MMKKTNIIVNLQSIIKQRKRQKYNPRNNAGNLPSALTPRAADRYQRRQMENQVKRDGKLEDFKTKKKNDRAKRLNSAGCAAVAATTIASAKACHIPKLNFANINNICNHSY